jgi:anti-anti-sigma factor
MRLTGGSILHQYLLMSAERLQEGRGPVAVAGDDFRVETRRHGASIVLECRGELDIAGLDVARAALADAETSEAVLVVLDLTRLEFLDCSGLEAILDARRRLDAGGRAVEIVALPAGPVHRLFTLLGLEALLRPGEP